LDEIEQDEEIRKNINLYENKLSLGEEQEDRLIMLTTEKISDAVEPTDVSEKPQENLIQSEKISDAVEPTDVSEKPQENLIQ
jgi:hypothetical protein